MTLTYSSNRENGIVIVWQEGCTERGEFASVYADLSNAAGDFEEKVERARMMCAAPSLVEVLEQYERWEADILLSDEAWHGGMAELPTIPQHLWDRAIEIQQMRNHALKEAGRDPWGRGQIESPPEYSERAAKPQYLAEKLDDDYAAAKTGAELSERAQEHVNQLTECASCGVLHLEEELYDGKHLEGACLTCLGER